jgi:ABC-type lipoprotein export system ATPase subunit
LQYSEEVKKKTAGVSYRKPRRIFEKSGTVYPEKSYYVPLENVGNVDKQDIKTMVDNGRYFSIFAPRQSGKTTFLKHLISELHMDSTYITVLLSFQKFAKLDKETFQFTGSGKLFHTLPLLLFPFHVVKNSLTVIFSPNQRLSF